MSFSDKQNPHNDPRIPYLNSYAYILDRAYSYIATSIIPMSAGYTDGSISWEDIEDPFGLAAQIEEEMGEQFVSVISGLKVAEYAIKKVGERILSEVPKKEDSDIWRSISVVAPKRVPKSAKTNQLIRQIELYKVMLPALEAIEKTMVEVEAITGIGKDCTHYYSTIADDFCDDSFVPLVPIVGHYRFNPLDFFVHSSATTRSFINEINNFLKKGEEELQSVGVVYLVGSIEGRVLKIGHTTRGITQRLKELQVGCSHVLEVIKTKIGTRATEKEELIKAHNFRIGAEWFTWDDSIIQNF